MTCSVGLTSFGLLFDNFTRSAMRDKSSFLEGVDTEYCVGPSGHCSDGAENDSMCKPG